MRVATCSNVLKSINPCAAYCVTSSRIWPAAARAARRTVVVDDAESALLRARPGLAAVGKLCTRNVYINIPTGASVLLRSVSGWTGATPPRPLVAGEHPGLPALVEREHLVALGGPAFHSGRSHWHSWNGEASDPRLLREEPIDVGRWDVAFDQVSVHDCRVARGQSVRNSECALDLRHVG